MRLLLSFLLLFFANFVFGQDFQWAKGIKGSSIQDSRFLEIDQNENSYTLGKTTSRYLQITSSGEYVDLAIYDENTDSYIFGDNIFLIKKDINGEHIWSKLLSEIPFATNCSGLKIGTDGFLYVAYNNNKKENNDYFFYATILKLDLDGNEINRFQYRNYTDSENSGFSMTSFDLASENNIYIGGYYSGQIQLELNNPNSTLPQSADISGFVARISNSGNLDWIIQMGIWIRLMIKLSPDDKINVITTAEENDNLSLKLINLNRNNGEILWENNLPEIFHRDFDVAPNGTIVIIGETSDLIDVDLSENEFWLDGSVVLWYNNLGEFITGYQYQNIAYLSNVSCDDENNIYVMGPIGFGSNTQIDLDPTDSIFIVDVDFFRGGFFTQFNESFQFETAAIIGQSSPYNCTDLEPFDLKAKNNSYYITGNYLGNCDFDPSEDIFHLGDTDYEGTSSRDGFILKYSSVCQDIPPTGEPELSFCENENSKISDLTPNQSYIKWYDSITSTTPLENDVPLVNGQTYFAARQIGNCPESSERLEVLVTINPASPEPQVLN